MNALTKPAGDILVPGYVPPLASFLRRRVIGAAGARMDWEDVYQTFAGPGTGWHSPPSRKAFVEAMAYLCAAKRVGIAVDGSRVYCLDCSLEGTREVECAAPAEAEAPRPTWAARARAWCRFRRRSAAQAS